MFRDNPPAKINNFYRATGGVEIFRLSYKLRIPGYSKIYTVLYICKKLQDLCHSTHTFSAVSFISQPYILISCITNISIFTIYVRVAIYIFESR